MKKIIIILSTTLFVTNLFAQVSWAIKAGPNFSTARAYYNDIKQPTSFNYGYGVGVLLTVPFEGILHFSPSVMINRRGFIIKPLTGTNIKEQYGITYLDLIPTLSIYLPQGNNKLVISLGPDFGFTNFGKLKATNTNNVTTTQSLKFSFINYGNFDAGINASVAYHFKKMFVEAGFLYGLVSINNNESTDQRNIRNRMLSINLGYFIK